MPATSIRTGPSLMVLLNAEWDHPDVFADEEAVLAHSRSGSDAGNSDRPTLIANIDRSGRSHDRGRG